MIVWIVLTAMTLGVALALAAPLLRRNATPVPGAAHDLEVYRDQLAEIERDLARGTLSASEAEAARAEIARRAIGAANRLPSEPPSSTPVSRGLVLTVAVAAPLAALLLYATWAGSPTLPGQPFASRESAPDDTGARVVQMVEALAGRLKENPNDLEGWTMLARSYGQLDRTADSVAAWRKVMELSGNAAGNAASLGEALVRDADGMVTPEARALFERALAVDARDVRGAFYLGNAYAQEGDARRAIQIWTDLIATSPADAPWIANVRERIRRVAADAKIDPATIAPSPEALAAAQRGPSAADIAAVQRMSPEERLALVRSMVGQLETRLESEPGDIEGWRRLGRSYMLLTERDKARQAYAKAAALAPDRPDILAEYAATLLGDRGPDEKLPDAFVTLMRRVLELDGENVEALWFVGLAEAELNHKEAALALWSKLVGRIPPTSPAAAELQRRIEQLRSAN